MALKDVKNNNGQEVGVPVSRKFTDSPALSWCLQSSFQAVGVVPSVFQSVVLPCHCQPGTTLALTPGAPSESPAWQNINPEKAPGEPFGKFSEGLKS